tara:strand:+ start:112 stop:540 length:429 start_codon:yes stop_codon:yes gene_type:complete
MLREIKVKYSTPKMGETIKAPEMAAKYLRNVFGDEIEYREIMVALYFNRMKKIIGHHIVSMGGQSETTCDPKIVFGVALKCKADSIILSHNHPSGDPSPSYGDIAMTKRMVEGGQLLGVDINDHIIVTTKSFNSMRRSTDIW